MSPKCAFNVFPFAYTEYGKKKILSLVNVICVLDLNYIKLKLFKVSTYLIIKGLTILRGGRVTTALIGASSSKQVFDCVGAIENMTFTAEELSEIDRLSGDIGINLWAKSSETE